MGIILIIRPLHTTSDSSRLFFLPSEGNNPSPFNALSQHVSRKISAQLSSPFWLEYRLLVETSSLLPGALDSRMRRSMQILTLGQFPEKTYVLTEPQDNSTSTIVTLPSGAAANSFFNMVTAKMQPLWAARNEIRLDKGASVELTGGDVLAVRVGELRATVGQRDSKLRGVIIELTMQNEDSEDGEEIDWTAREITLRAALDATFRGSSISLTNAKLVQKSTSKQPSDPEHADIVRLYADLLKVAAPAVQR